MSEPSRSHFVLFGFPVRVTPFFLVVMAALGYPGGERFDARFFTRIGLWIGIVTISILWHELGHAFVMRRYGYEPSIELHGLGGRTSWGRGPSAPTAAQRVWVSLAGPFAGFFLGAPFLVLSFAGATGIAALDHAFQLLWIVNIGWGVLNLVPMLPWDGGHALEGVIDRFSGGRGRVPAAIVTIVVAIPLGIAAWIYLGSLWAVMLCLLSVATAMRAIGARRTPIDPADALAGAQRALEKVGPAALVSAVLLGQRDEAWARVADELEQRVLPKCEAATQRAIALELVAWARLLGGDLDGAARTAGDMRPTHDPSAVLGATIAAARGPLELARSMAEEIDEPDARVRVLAFVQAARGESERAMETIGEAHDVGAMVDAALFHQGHFDSAAELGERLFARFAEPEDAYNAACSHARAGRLEVSLEWLERAIEAGYRDLAHLEADADLGEVRRLARYSALRERIQLT